MLFMVWFLGVVCCVLGLELSLSAHDWFRWLWCGVLVFWFFAGMAMAGLKLAKLASGKVGARLAGGSTPPATSVPFTEKLK